MKDINILQDEIIKSDIKNAEKIWKDAEGDNSLESLLSKMTKDELVKIARKYFVKGITTLTKADAVHRVKEVIINNGNSAINMMDENTLKFLEDLIKNNGFKKYECTDIIYANFLRNRGIAFTVMQNEEPFIVLPEEIKPLVENISSKELKDKVRVNNEIIKIIAGMAYYYGVITVEFIEKTINSLYGKNFELDYIKALILAGEELGYDYVVNNDTIAHIDVEDTEKIIELQNICTSDYYKFDKKSLIKAGAVDFLEENKQSLKLQKVLGELFVVDKEILRSEMDALFFEIKNEGDKDNAIELFLDAYEIESDEEKKIFKEELDTLVKSIRRWSLKGHTEDEIEKAAARVVKEIKIGRNDPCICGSGKKYKKCCG